VAERKLKRGMIQYAAQQGTDRTQFTPYILAHALEKGREKRHKQINCDGLRSAFRLS
jgi:hypothetical protein